MAVTQKEVIAGKADGLCDHFDSGILSGMRKWQAYSVWSCLSQ